VSGRRRAPAALPPGKTRYPLYGRLVRPQGWSGWVQKSSPPPRGFEPRTGQPVASRYTGYAIPGHKSNTRAVGKYVGPNFLLVCVLAIQANCFWHVYVLGLTYFVWPWAPYRTICDVTPGPLSATDTYIVYHVTHFEASRNVILHTRYVSTYVAVGCGWGRGTKKKVNVYLPSLRMKVPDRVYVLGHTYTGHTLIKYNRYA
jgi:hypothetical protein